MNFAKLGQVFAPSHWVKSMLYKAQKRLEKVFSPWGKLLQQLSFRQRILLTFLPIVVVGSVLQVLIAGDQIQSMSMEFFQTQVEAEALKIAASLPEPMEHYLEGKGGQDIQNALSSLQFDAAWHYLLVDSNRRIIAFTLGDGYESQQVAEQTPDLAQAARGRTGVDIRPFAGGEDYLFVATPIYYEQHPIGYFVLSRSLTPLYQSIHQQWIQLVLASLPVLLLIFIASLWISSTILRPIVALQKSALKMAQGELGVKMPVEREDELGDLSKAFNHMSEQLDKILTAQRSFVNNAAHELRNPLMTMRLRLDAIANQTLDEGQKAQYIADLQQEVSHMAELVTSLLTLARIDEGRHVTNGAVEETSTVLSDIGRNWRIRAQQAGLSYEAEIEELLPAVTISDNDLRLVLNNLLGNAIKYTQQGKVGLKAYLEGDNVVVQVWDTGVGFNPTEAERLFERFYRDESVRHDYEGNGLGLAIVKAVLEQYGATITAYSEGEQRGAWFTVHLPVV